MKIIDITRTLQDAPIYPGSPPATVEQDCAAEGESPFRTSVITAGSHMGTHADAANHIMPNSGEGIDKMPLERYYGSCRVMTFAKNAPIRMEALTGRLSGCRRLVIRGGGYLTNEAANCIVEAGITTVVTDGLSIAPLDNEEEIHSIILGAGLAVVENVVLDGVSDGDYLLCAFPNKIGGCDGAPVRAVLIEQ